MTQTETRAGARPRGRTRAEQAALRALARSAAEAREPLAAIARSLQIPDSTLSNWALADGFRTCDLRVRAGAGAVTEDAAVTIRQQAEEMWQEGNDGSLGWRTAAQATLDLARVRAFPLIEAGYLDAAEAEMISVRRLARLLAFARPISGPMGALHRRAEWEAELERHYATLDAPAEAPRPSAPPARPPACRTRPRRNRSATKRCAPCWQRIGPAAAKREPGGRRRGRRKLWNWPPDNFPGRNFVL